MEASKMVEGLWVRHVKGGELLRLREFRQVMPGWVADSATGVWVIAADGSTCEPWVPATGDAVLFRFADAGAQEEPGIVREVGPFGGCSGPAGALIVRVQTAAGPLGFARHPHKLGYNRVTPNGPELLPVQAASAPAAPFAVGDWVRARSGSTDCYQVVGIPDEGRIDVRYSPEPRERTPERFGAVGFVKIAPPPWVDAPAFPDEVCKHCGRSAPAPVTETLQFAGTPLPPITEWVMPDGTRIPVTITRGTGSPK